MACPVNAVDSTASASTPGVTAAIRGSGSGTTSSVLSPTSSTIGIEQGEQYLLAVAEGQPQLGAGLRGEHPPRRAGAGPRSERPGRLNGPPRWRSLVALAVLCSMVSSRARSRPQLPPGQLQEHVLQAASGHLHVVGQRALVGAPRGDHREHGRVDSALHDVAAGDRLGGAVAGGQRVRPGRCTFMPGRARNRSSCWSAVEVRAAGLPWATTRPWSTITTWSASASASSIRCVVSSTATPSRRSALDQLPDQASALRVHAGRRLVEEHQLRAPDHRAGQRQPLLLAAGEPLVRGARAAVEAEHRAEPVARPADAPSRRPPPAASPPARTVG